ncbi:MAG: DUF6265 family protein [Bacteroidota bacterium]
MKKTGILLLIAVIISSFSSCVEKSNNGTKVRAEEKGLNENFDWLLGNWKRNNEEEGKETFEVWIKISSSEYSGIGFTMQNGDTLKQEKIRLIKPGEEWILEVQPQDEPNPITFSMTSHKEQEFICENEELDFPKLIKYWKSKNKLNALVSGDDMEIPFEFERVIGE